MTLDTGNLKLFSLVAMFLQFCKKAGGCGGGDTDPDEP